MLTWSYLLLATNQLTQGNSKNGPEWGMNCKTFLAKSKLVLSRYFFFYGVYLCNIAILRMFIVLIWTWSIWNILISILKDFIHHVVTIHKKDFRFKSCSVQSGKKKLYPRKSESRWAKVWYLLKVAQFLKQVSFVPPNDEHSSNWKQCCKTFFCF